MVFLQSAERAGPLSLRRPSDLDSSQSLQCLNLAKCFDPRPPASGGDDSGVVCNSCLAPPRTKPSFCRAGGEQQHSLVFGLHAQPDQPDPSRKCPHPPARGRTCLCGRRRLPHGSGLAVCGPPGVPVCFGREAETPPACLRPRAGFRVSLAKQPLEPQGGPEPAWGAPDSAGEVSIFGKRSWSQIPRLRASLITDLCQSTSQLVAPPKALPCTC